MTRFKEGQPWLYSNNFGLKQLSTTNQTFHYLDTGV